MAESEQKAKRASEKEKKSKKKQVSDINKSIILNLSWILSNHI